MEKESSLPHHPSLTSLHSTASSSQSVNRVRHYQYDVLSLNEIRLFKLELNAADEPLSGALMTTYHIWNAYDLTKRHYNARRSQETEAVMKKLTKSKKYDTFSYSWGDQSETFPLKLSLIGNKLGPNDEPKLDFEAYRNGTIQIGKNLKDLLEELRKRQYGRFVWIDAICINQANDAEKRMQIPMMRNIFEYSEDGYVWLGRGFPDEIMAMKMLPGVVEKLAEANENGSDVLPGKVETFVDLGIPSPENRFWEALRLILKNPWWSRLWTLQEVVVPAKEGQAGFWSDFPATVVWLADTSTDLYIFNRFSIVAAALGLRAWIISGEVGTRVDAMYAFHGIDEIRVCRESWVFDIRGVKLSALLLGTRRRKSTLAADAVYGMLAMMDSHMSKMLDPGDKSTVKDLFVKFAKHYVRNEHREHLFSHLSTEQRLEGLPSWCPNFASSPANVPLGSRWFGRVELSESEQDQMFHAGYRFKGKSRLPKSKVAALKGIANAFRGRNIYDRLYDTNDPRQITPMPDSDCLLVSGMHLDIVAETVECNPATRFSNFFSPESSQLTRNWEAQCLQLTMKYFVSDEDKFEAYARTLSTNRASVEFSDGRPILFDHEYVLDFLDFYRKFKDFIRSDLRDDGEQSIEDKLGPDTWHYIDVISHVTRGRKFFSTEGGRIGLGPEELEPGDAVCVLFFCPTPYILRHYPTGRSRLIGESYVHGIMYGEALDMLDRHEIEETKWVIE